MTPNIRLRGALAALMLATLSGCATLNAASTPQNTADKSPAVMCSEPRPRVCTMEYMPVCAQLIDGGEQVFASKCNACADITVAAYIPQPCEAR